MIKKLLLVFALGLFSLTSVAQVSEDDVAGDDAYDPFADYSEFEASADEEADIHFFKNGRFFNFAFLFGGRMFTQTLGELTEPAVAYGVAITYFFDIRSALQVSYVHGEHSFHLKDGVHPSEGPYVGFNANSALSTISAHYKYYFNTQNITRGFADLNPYIIGGFSLNYRTISGISLNDGSLQEDVVVKSDPTGIDIGFGLEVPMARNKMYFGFQMMYHYVSFPDENVEMVSDSTPTTVYPNGDYATGLLVLGINF